jgi:hypothetical protein
MKDKIMPRSPAQHLKPVPSGFCALAREIGTMTEVESSDF